MPAHSPPPGLPPDLESAYQDLTRDLQSVFGPRLQAVVAFGPRLRAAGRRRAAAGGDALVLVDRVTVDDLAACATHADRWDSAGLRMPLVLGREEFARSLDVFPLEYDDIIAHHVAVLGDDPFGGLSVRAEDLRRACEARAKSHLVHLREGYLETRGRPAGIASLIIASASPFSSLLGNLSRLEGRPAGTTAQRAGAVGAIPGLDAAAVSRVLELETDPMLSADEAATLYPKYLASVERLVGWVDAWARS